MKDTALLILRGLHCVVEIFHWVINSQISTHNHIYRSSYRAVLSWWAASPAEEADPQWPPQSWWGRFQWRPQSVPAPNPGPHALSVGSRPLRRKTARRCAPPQSRILPHTLDRFRRRQKFSLKQYIGIKKHYVSFLYVGLVISTWLLQMVTFLSSLGRVLVNLTNWRRKHWIPSIQGSNWQLQKWKSVVFFSKS